MAAAASIFKAAFVTAMVLFVAHMVLSDVAYADSFSTNKVDMATAPTRRLLQTPTTEFCQSPPPCPITSIRNVTCKVGGVVNCECYYVGRCFPDAHGCYMLSASERTFCGF